jgi:hypothetical protein
MKLFIVAALVIVVASATESAEDTFSSQGDGSSLMGVSSFAMLDTKAHLAYLSAKSYAAKHAPDKIQAASAKCDKIRRDAFQSCGKYFCECQDKSECSSLDLSVFLETPNFALKAAKDECTAQKIHAGCRESVTQAYGQCRDTFLQTSPPSHQTLMQIKDVAEFVHLAGQFSRDGHVHIFDTDLLQARAQAVAAVATGSGAVSDAVADAEDEPAPDAEEGGKPLTESEAPAGVAKDPLSAGAGSGSAMGPEPNQEQAYIEHLRAQTTQWEEMEATQRKVLQDEHEVGDLKTDPATQAKTMESLKLAISKCSKLKEMTFNHCGEMMCEYHDECGTAHDIKVCKDHAAFLANQAKHKEAQFKVDRRLANMKEAHTKEKSEKGPELKKKAEDKEAAWKAGAPERAAKKEEFKEINEKSKKMVGSWTKGIDAPWSDHDLGMGRRLLEEKDLNAEEQMKKVADEDAQEKAHKKSIDDKLNSEKCKHKATGAFNTCEVLTAKAYDECDQLLNTADADFVEGMKRDAEAAVAKAAVDAQPADHIEQAGGALPAPAYASGEVENAHSYTNGEVSTPVTPDQVTTPAVLPAAAKVAPLGEATSPPEVQNDKVLAHAETEATASDLKVEQSDEESGNFPGSTAAAKAAMQNAEEVVGQHEETASDDLKTNADGDAMYQVYSNLYDSLIQDTPTVDAPTGTTEASGTGTGTPVEETLYQQEARLFDEVVDEE